MFEFAHSSCVHPTAGLLKGIVAVFPIRKQSLSPLTESQQSITRRYEAAVLHLQLWIDTSLKGLISNPQSFNSELLQPLVESVCKGFKGALLLCGASTTKIHNLVDASVIKQVHPHITLDSGCV